MGPDAGTSSFARGALTPKSAAARRPIAAPRTFSLVRMRAAYVADETSARGTRSGRRRSQSGNPASGSRTLPSPNGGAGHGFAGQVVGPTRSGNPASGSRTLPSPNGGAGHGFAEQA